MSKWENDAMVVVFPTHKGDEEGNDGLPKHVVTNPSCPSSCTCGAWGSDERDPKRWLKECVVASAHIHFEKE